MAVFKAIAQSLSEPRTCVQQRHECKQIATTTAGIPISFDKQLICAAPLSLDNNINNSRSISLARADAAKINRRGFATAHASSPRICLYFKHLPHTLHGHISTGVIGGLWVLRYLLNAHYARALSHDVFFLLQTSKIAQIQRSSSNSQVCSWDAVRTKDRTPWEIADLLCVWRHERVRNRYEFRLILCSEGIKSCNLSANKDVTADNDLIL